MKEERINFWANLPYPVRASTNISSDEKLLYAEVVARLTPAGCCKTSNETFARFFNTDIRTISRRVKNLVTWGYMRITRDYKRHIRKLWPLEIQIPDVAEEPEKWSEKQKMFAKAFPERQIDMADIPDSVDMELLIQKIKESKFLSKAKNMSLRSCVLKYKAIVADGYHQFSEEKKKKSGTERSYTEEEANALFQSADEVEI